MLSIFLKDTYFRSLSFAKNVYFGLLKLRIHEFAKKTGAKIDVKEELLGGILFRFYAKIA